NAPKPMAIECGPLQTYWFRFCCKRSWFRSFSSLSLAPGSTGGGAGAVLGCWPAGSLVARTGAGAALGFSSGLGAKAIVILFTSFHVVFQPTPRFARPVSNGIVTILT